ncbi:FkbM family methyltransferase [Nodularia harveyana UHCC-0300]|uniref:FkbM family methyltransferase n=1 Tax=Nodularia harveyana UHCC-0300 TaxID=2974287 RepID=A0ABU5UE28_9CYAN|nr:FkbM family methyltransferase [Nodularia harveyana]MEA5581256.1 FkbM family methyltransferase [Nodularia harveyana UHCC-0300]
MVKNLEKKWLRDLLIPLDYWRYLLWRLSRSSEQITVKLAESGKIVIRPLPTTDLIVAYEIFLGNAYQKPMAVPEIHPQLIVDIGANVGYSIIDFTHKYPSANLVAFEPHPAHLAVIHRHLEINNLLNKVQVVGSAASNCNADMFLTNRGGESTVIESLDSDCLPIKVCDFFTWMGTQTIDLLKMDIEGGEYAILNDKRLETVNIRKIVLEWHNTEEIPNGHQWCSDRLTALGYKVTDGQLRYANTGILWAWK